MMKALNTIVSTVIILAVMIGIVISFAMWIIDVSQSHVKETHLFIRLEKIERVQGGWNVTLYVENPSGYTTQVVEVRVYKKPLYEYNVTFYNQSDLPLILKPGERTYIKFFFPDTVFVPGGLVEIDIHAWSGETYMQVARFTLT